MVIKEASFPSMLALEAWKQGKMVNILSHTEVLQEWAYPTSARLSRPKIKVTYMEWNSWQD